MNLKIGLSLSLGMQGPLCQGEGSLHLGSDTVLCDYLQACMDMVEHLSPSAEHMGLAGPCQAVLAAVRGGSQMSSSGLYPFVRSVHNDVFYLKLLFTIHQLGGPREPHVWAATSGGWVW